MAEVLIYFIDAIRSIIFFKKLKNQKTIPLVAFQLVPQ